MNPSQETSLRQILIDAKVDETVINQLFDELHATDHTTEENLVPNVEGKISELTVKIQEESDWRKKAILAAERVKLGLDRT